MMRHAGCALAMMACATSEPVGITGEEYDEVAVSLASTLRPAGGGGELGALLEMVAFARGESVEGFVQATDGSFHGNHVGLWYGYELTCRDDHNRAVPCSHRTDNADARGAWSGSLDLPFMAMSIERTGEWMLNDLAADVVRVDGFGTLTCASDIAHPDRGPTSYRFTYEAEHRGVFFARGDIWPRRGIALYRLVESTRAIELGAEVQFIAGGHALITLDDKRRYKVDLAIGTITLTLDP